MKKMSDVFDMSKSIGYASHWSDDKVRHADKAIKMHDDLVTMLGRAREIIADDPLIGFRGIGLVVQIDKLLERCK